MLVEWNNYNLKLQVVVPRENLNAKHLKRSGIRSFEKQFIFDCWYLFPLTTLEYDNNEC